MRDLSGEKVDYFFKDIVLYHNKYLYFHIFPKKLQTPPRSFFYAFLKVQYTM